MTSRQFVAIAIRLFAIWLALSSIQSVLTIFVLNGKFSVAAYLAYALVYALFAAFLWSFPMKIAGHILSGSPDDSPSSVTPRGLVHAAIVAAGFMLVAETLPHFLNTLAFAIEIPLREFPDPTTLLRMAIPLAEIIVALVMILRAPWLASSISSDTRGVKGDL
jgi:hypothetical protein